MDWAKAKNVLIVVFLLLNIFLAATIFLSYGEDGVQRKNAVNAAKILEEQGVVLKYKIPEISESYRISYGNAALDKKGIASILMGDEGLISGDLEYGTTVSKGSKSLTFKDSCSFTYVDSNPAETVNLKDKEKIIKYCVKFLNRLELPVSEFYTDDDEYITRPDGSIHIVLNEKYNNHIIFSNEFKMDVSANGITRLECKLVKVDRNQSTKIKNIVPAYQILLRHYIGNKDTVITDIDIGFDCTYVEKGKSSITYPVWRVRTQDGKKPRFFSAMDGAEKEM